MNQKMIEQARKQHRRSLQIGSIIISLSGLFLMILALLHIMDYDSDLDSIPFHLLFLFGSILAFLGVLTAPGEK